VDYLYGIDLYNYAYWWESHEIFEGLWHAVGHHTEQGNFFQALIQFAAANLKRFTGNHRAAGNLVTNGIVRLQKIPTRYMGIDVARLTQDFRQPIVDSDFRAPLIRLYEREQA
jgi:predicted metal-dependent hydrolase